MLYPGRFYIATKPFVRAICEAGANQLPRLAFADWLYEHGYENEGFGEQWIAKQGKWQDCNHHTGGWFVGGRPGHTNLSEFIHNNTTNWNHDVIRNSKKTNLLIGEYLLLYCLKQLTPEQYV